MGVAHSVSFPLGAFVPPATFPFRYCGSDLMVFSKSISALSWTWDTRRIGCEKPGDLEFREGGDWLIELLSFAVVDLKFDGWTNFPTAFMPCTQICVQRCFLSNLFNNTRFRKSVRFNTRICQPG
ncbi:hypothetical protein ABKN59_009387 [Abortiporus biennis]